MLIQRLQSSPLSDAINDQHEGFGKLIYALYHNTYTIKAICFIENTIHVIFLKIKKAHWILMGLLKSGPYTIVLTSGAHVILVALAF